MAKNIFATTEDRLIAILLVIKKIRNCNLPMTADTKFTKALLYSSHSYTSDVH